MNPLVQYFLNDEITASLHERGGIRDLKLEILRDHLNSGDRDKIDLAFHDIIDMYANRTDHMIGVNILGFVIDTYSSFEKFTCEIFDKIVDIEDYEKSKELKFKTLLGKYEKEHDQDKRTQLVDKMKKITFYISGAEKINYVISRLEVDKLEKTKIRDFIDFYRNQRNTVHNLGVHHGNNMKIDVDDIEISLNSGRGGYTKDYNALIFSCNKLMSTYERLLEVQRT
ncbi:hypothetical protein L1D34_11670 [Vibrio mediterranei]|uniref:hypothetical protein n=1 Tax=Vibrio mediterranei TaxID=689 RepID=UPI001EFE77EC|nr:hypothetical protein [Vibrio mediterranei]MCG9625499.1 hypothetical protein [Vibrio mediterranei]